MKAVLFILAASAWMVLAQESTSIPCAGNEYQCEGTDHCIEIGQVCDGHVDCHAHGDDEIGCDNTPDPSNCNIGEYQCLETHHCIDIGLVCDGHVDCHALGDDEIGC